MEMITTECEAVISAILSVTENKPVQLHSPVFKGNEKNYLIDCIDSTFVSSVGVYVDAFERGLEKYTGAKHVVAVMNGTAALHICLLLAGVKPGHEVLVPSLSFVATANAVLYCSAIPHFAEINEHNFGIDAKLLRKYLTENTRQVSGKCINKNTNRVLKALVPMHVFGHPSDLVEILLICNEFNIVMVEDAAESLGSFYQGTHTGNLGLLGALSFNGNKIITTGGGGAIMTNNSLLAEKAKYITTTAKAKHLWLYDHTELGFNYRMPNINAALGCAQLEGIDEILLKKRELYSRYAKSFSSQSVAKLVKEPEHSTSNYWLQTIKLNKPSFALRDEILKVTNHMGIATRPAWNLLPNLEHLKKFPRMRLTCSKDLLSRIINIPSGIQICDSLNYSNLK
jgi:perosamine synthetase